MFLCFFVYFFLLFRVPSYVKYHAFSFLFCVFDPVIVPFLVLAVLVTEMPVVIFGSIWFFFVHHPIFLGFFFFSFFG